MPEKYHIHTKPVPPRLPRIGKHGIVDWREDCARCHNCVKKACVYDRYRQEAQYIRTLEYSDFLFFECMGCLSCVQNCTKNLLCLTINSEYEKLGNRYWTPEIIHSTWQQAETASVPVSGAGYRGKFAGHGFDAMWTDMSEIVRPTRDGIHGREYISTSVDIGKKPSYLNFENNGGAVQLPAIIDIPMPLIIDMNPPAYGRPCLEPYIIQAAAQTGLIALVDSGKWAAIDGDSRLQPIEQYLPHIAFHLNPDAPELPRAALAGTKLVEIPDGEKALDTMAAIKAQFPGMIVSVRVPLEKGGTERAVALADAGAEVIHVVADLNGDEIGVDNPRFIKDMIRAIHKALIKGGRRDEVTLIAGGGIALPEHMAKALLCGADLVSSFLPFMIALECRLCKSCRPGQICPARIESISFEYGTGRVRNLIAAWHLQLIELMGAMGMREARRLRGDVGRAMFFEELEEDIFGKIFGTRKRT
ncbi:MAG: glutamate synthase-related protein [Thermodesulfobacteriota bacterium]